MSDDESNELYEIIESPGTRGDIYHYIQSLDLSHRPVYQQIGIGTATGWCAGFVLKKVGKVAATAIGGTLLTLQLASHLGYVKINWGGIRRDMERVTDEIEDQISQGNRQEAAEKVFKECIQFVKKNLIVAGGFSGGFLLGMALS